MMPGSRQYLCYVDGIGGNGAMSPTNPACAAALAQSGTTPLYNWFAVLDSNGQGRTEGYIPDGEICTGGNNGPYDFSGYEAARSDWPTTHLTAGETIRVKYNNWAKHPGDFDVYITKDGWTPDTPLAWKDLDLIDTATNPPSDGGPGTDEGHYYWDLDLPEGKTGKHMIFIHWVRSDSPENFYACSDVEFDGGNGEVTGLGSGTLSAGEVAAAAEEFENTEAQPIHDGEHGEQARSGDEHGQRAEHGQHAQHGAPAAARRYEAGETRKVASAEEQPAASTTAVATAAAGAALAAFAGGAVLLGRRRRSAATD
nr:lytic polysaccharide monooxygenase [Streptomyces albus]